MRESEEEDIFTYLAVLWRRKWLILGGTASLVLVVIVLAMFAVPKRFEATALLASTHAKAGTPDGASALGSDALTGLVKNPTPLAEAVRRLDLDKPPLGLTTRQLAESITVKGIKGTNLLSLAVTLPDGKLAADTANFLAERALELSVHAREGDDHVRQAIAQELESARSALDQADSALLDFRRTTRVVVLQAEERARVEERRRLMQELAAIGVEQAGIRAEVAQLKTALQRHEPLITLRRSLVDDATLPSPRAPDAANRKSDRQLQTQEINRVYQELQQRIVAAEARAAALASQRTATDRQIQENDGRLRELAPRVATGEAKLDQLTRNRTSAEAMHQALARKLSETVLAAASRTTKLELVDRARPPAMPVSRGLRFSALVAALIGIVGFAVVALILEGVQRARASRPARVDTTTR